LKLALSGVVATGLSGVGACAGADESGGPAETGTVTVRWWDYLLEPVRQAGVRAMISAIEKAVPQVRIERRVMPFNELAAAIESGIGSGDLPDIAIVDNPTVGPLAAKGALADLTAKVREWGQGDSYFAGAWKSCQSDGKVVAIPNNVNCLALYYNKDMLSRAGVKPPATWSDLSAAARKLTAGHTRGLALSGTKGEEGVFQFLPFLWQTGGDLDTFAVDGAKALSFLADLIKDGAIAKDCLGWTQQDVNTQFLSGMAAMQVNGPWQLPMLQGQPAVRWGVVPLPVGRTTATALGGENWVIFNNARADLAWQVVVRSQQPDLLVPFLTALGVLPARTDVGDRGPWATDQTLQLFLQQMDNARPRAFGAGYGKLSAAVSQAQQAAFSGSRSPAEAATTAAAAIAANLPE
jgi:multiple sugar transport system substrate-binding protein